MKVHCGSYAGFHSIDLEWMDYKLSITPTIGGRILGFSYRGHDMLYAMPSLMGKKFNLELNQGQTIDEKRLELGMKLYGGFKTWLAPQDLWKNAPYIDLDLGEYSATIEQTLDSIAVILKSPICRQTGIQFLRKVSIFKDNPTVEVMMGMKNRSEHEVCYGLWDVTQVNSPGNVYFPTKQDATYSKWGEVQMEECLENNLVKVNCHRPLGMFKIGIDYSEGWMLSTTQNDRYGYVKRFEVVEGKQCGHQNAIEIFNANQYSYFEAEVHGQMTALKPNEEFYMKQYWNIIELPENYSEHVREIVKNLGG